LETLLYIALSGLLKKTYEIICARADYAVMAFEIAALMELEANADVLRERAPAALAKPFSSLFVRADLVHNQWDFEGTYGIAKLVESKFGNDHRFLNILSEKDDSNPVKSAFLELHIDRVAKEKGSIEFFSSLSGRLGELREGCVTLR
jgi:hypothetical protein